MILQNLYRVGGLHTVVNFLTFKFLNKINLKPFTIHTPLYVDLFKNKEGIEIGGPSAIFNQLPIYEYIKGIDGCNYSSKTVWEGEITEGFVYKVGNKSGYQFISEASNLSSIPDEKYDFLISSHCLEHCANALKTVQEWVRVLKPGGIILLILPNKQFTFDHNRPVTSFDHLLEDYKKNIDEDDLTHMKEILSLHDLEMDKPAGTLDQFRSRCMDNYTNRCMHHHVFDFELLEKILEFSKVQVIHKEMILPYHQIIIGKK